MLTRNFEIACDAELEGREYKLRLAFRPVGERRAHEYVFGVEQLELHCAQLFQALRQLQQLNMAAGTFIGAASEAKKNGEA